jgi:hypothetical protein
VVCCQVGHGYWDQTKQQYSQDPVGSAISDAGAAAMIAGPLAGVLGAGADVAGEGSLAGRTLSAAGRGVERVGAAAQVPAVGPLAPLALWNRVLDGESPILGRVRILGSSALSTDAGVSPLDRMQSVNETMAARVDAARASIGGKLIPSGLLRGQVADAASQLAKTLSPDEQGAVAAIIRNESGGWADKINAAVDHTGLSDAEAARVGKITEAAAADLHNNRVFAVNDAISSNVQVSPAQAAVRPAVSAGHASCGSDAASEGRCGRDIEDLAAEREHRAGSPGPAGCVLEVAGRSGEVRCGGGADPFGDVDTGSDRCGGGGAEDDGADTRQGRGGADVPGAVGVPAVDSGDGSAARAIDGVARPGGSRCRQVRTARRRGTGQSRATLCRPGGFEVGCGDGGGAGGRAYTAV